MTNRASYWKSRRRFLGLSSASVAILLTAAVTWLWAHPGHAPLPTKGVVVDVATGQIILSAEARDALDVRSAEIGSQPLPEKLLAYATVVAPWQNHAFASSRLPGKIVTMGVKPGQVVEAGQVLAELRSVDLEILQLELLTAKNENAFSQKVLQGLYKASEAGAISPKELHEAEVKHEQNLIALEIGKSKWRSLALAENTLDAILKGGAEQEATKLSIRSPISGRVIHADLSVGRVVEPSEHLLEIVDLSSVWVKIDVLEKDLNRVQTGQRVEIQLTACSDKVFESVIAFKAPYLDPQTHLNSVWAKLDNGSNEPEFLPGMAGHAQIVLSAAASAKTIPAAALINDGVDRFVLVEESKAIGNSEYRKRSVSVLRETSDLVEIQSADLLPGDRVVTQGSPELGGLLASGILKLTPQMERTIGLRVQKVQSQVVEDFVAMPGAVDVPPDQRGFASAQIAGELHKIRIEPGQSVVAGQVVAEVASLELQNLQLELLKEHGYHEFLKDRFERLKKIENAISRRIFIELENGTLAARTRRDSLLRRLDVLGVSTTQLDDLIKDKKLVQALLVRAPLSGIVVRFDKVLGQSLRAEEPLVEIHDLARPWVQGFVSERDLGRVGLNKSVRVRFVGDPGATFTGKIVRSAKVFAVDTRSLSVWIELDRYPSQPLIHGQLATLHLTVRQPPPTLAVPTPAIVREGTQTFVFVRQKDGSFDRRPVGTGRSDDRWIEISTGLQAGEEIAVAGTADLQTAYAALR